ncbi:FMN-linked oxidoreductase [Gloeophyllum trabeum ATCC 11539]|uniref:FMN-linked oxidoreductase n=1 Tax=Gloeophyllum trabeum (strain ATCC 11539 / FP-39264 / Madison 617) TaxID=670483 RepID=S7QCH4_GLOTA|nr:FMN-linked oxidoreductase [Gloeophyllum trabeum ATCC 11539]EPQ57037.1 FMN-linked oxidoreductase [Gloeophyllum trabeum ATCC 11539]
MDPAKVLGQQIKLPYSGKIVPNRFLKSAMTERLCTWDPDHRAECGKPTEGYINAYKRWGEGLTGVIVLGNIPVHRDYLEAAGNAIIDKNNPWDAVEAFKPAVAAAKAHGSLCIGQLTHAGRQAPDTVCEQPVSASDTKCPDGVMGLNFQPARAMTEEEIWDAIDRWAFGAEVLYKAGADGAQLHSAHGYLLSQFLSPLVNKRTDQWGGSFENRSRIVFEIIKAIRNRVPDESFIISIKINSHDFIDGGFSQEECATMVEKLEEARVDLIELSGGTYESLAFEHKKESTRRREGFFVEFADRIRPHVKKSVLCVTGGFRNAEPMAEAVKQDTCQIVGLARPLCAEPDLPKKILEGKSKGAAENAVESSLQTPAAVIQIHAMAENRPIPDTAKKEVAEEVTEMIIGKKPMPHAEGAKYPPI